MERDIFRSSLKESIWVYLFPVPSRVSWQLPGKITAAGFSLIREAGYNTMRLYTLHYPRFYEELRHFNLEHPQDPLLVMHGIWLEENETASDLFLQSADFDQEIREVVAAVHGESVIASRPGKAHGSFTADISPWVIGFLPAGRYFPPKWHLPTRAIQGDTVPGYLFPASRWRSCRSVAHQTGSTA